MMVRPCWTERNRTLHRTYCVVLALRGFPRHSVAICCCPVRFGGKRIQQVRRKHSGKLIDVGRRLLVLNRVRKLYYLLSNGTSNTNHRPAFRNTAEQRSGENRVWVVVIIAKAIEGPLAGAGRKECKGSVRELM